MKVSWAIGSHPWGWIHVARAARARPLGDFPQGWGWGAGLGEVRRNHIGQLDGVLCSRLDVRKASNRKVNCDQEQERLGGGWKAGRSMAQDRHTQGVWDSWPRLACQCTKALSQTRQMSGSWENMISALRSYKSEPQRLFITDALTTSANLWNICSALNIR